MTRIAVLAAYLALVWVALRTFGGGEPYLEEPGGGFGL